MNCGRVRDSISAFLDGRMPAGEAGDVHRHVSECRECGRYAKDLDGTRQAMLAFPQGDLPAELKSKLQVIASHAAVRQAQRRTWRILLRSYLADVRLALDNAMRPLALPLAGGVCSAMLLFLLLIPNLGVQRSVSNDVPIALYTEASMVEVAMVEMAPFNFGKYDDLMVEVSLDERGQITSYSLPRGGKVSPDFASDLGQMMLLSSFAPATVFGQPTASKLVLSFRRSRIVVRG